MLITGLGSEVGWRVAARLEANPVTEAIVGIDLEPPRRWLRRTDFHRVDPRDRRRITDIVRDLEPTVVVHLGVYEPHARATPASAIERNALGAVHVIGAAAEGGALERVIVRSGLEVYGRGRGAATRPAEDVAPEPTTAFGRSLAEVEHVAGAAGRVADVPVTCLRFAPIVGPHVASPLGRYLRLPVVPVGGLSEGPFSLVHYEDAAESVLRALAAGHDGAVNVVGGGAVTATQAVRMGGRVPVPLLGPGWMVARAVAQFVGAPVPDHVQELIVRGRAADGSLAARVLDFVPQHDTPSVVRELYEWADVTYLPVPNDAATGRTA